jgi:hypothetical protein
MRLSPLLPIFSGKRDLYTSFIDVTFQAFDNSCIDLDRILTNNIYWSSQQPRPNPHPLAIQYRRLNRTFQNVCFFL